MGKLPDEESATDKQLAELEILIHGIKPPVSIQEARLLFGILGEDTCFGAAWTILHLIETAPPDALRLWLKEISDGSFWGDNLKKLG